jgi:chromate transporter
MAGDGAAQAVPGPLFTFAAYVGAGLTQPPNGAAGAALCTLAIFLPSFLLVVGALPFWAQLRHAPRLQATLRGVNAAVVGLLAAAFCHPVLTSGILDGRDAVLALVAFALLEKGRAPSWLVVGLCAFAGGLL